MNSNVCGATLMYGETEWPKAVCEKDKGHAGPHASSNRERREIITWSDEEKPAVPLTERYPETEAVGLDGER